MVCNICTQDSIAIASDTDTGCNQQHVVPAAIATDCTVHCRRREDRGGCFLLSIRVRIPRRGNCPYYSSKLGHLKETENKFQL